MGVGSISCTYSRRWRSILQIEHLSGCGLVLAFGTRSVAVAVVDVDVDVDADTDVDADADLDADVDANADVDVEEEEEETQVRCTGGSNTKFTTARVTAICICWVLEALLNVSVTDF